MSDTLKTKQNKSLASTAIITNKKKYLGLPNRSDVSKLLFVDLVVMTGTPSVCTVTAVN